MRLHAERAEAVGWAGIWRMGPSRFDTAHLAARAAADIRRHALPSCLRVSSLGAACTVAATGFRLQQCCGAGRGAAGTCGFPAAAGAAGGCQGIGGGWQRPPWCACVGRQWWCACVGQGARFLPHVTEPCLPTLSGQQPAVRVPNAEAPPQLSRHCVTAPPPCRCASCMRSCGRRARSWRRPGCSWGRPGRWQEAGRSAAVPAGRGGQVGEAAGTASAAAGGAELRAGHAGQEAARAAPRLGQQAPEGGWGSRGKHAGVAGGSNRKGWRDA